VNQGVDGTVRQVRVTNHQWAEPDGSAAFLDDLEQSLVGDLGLPLSIGKVTGSGVKGHADKAIPLSGLTVACGTYHPVDPGGFPLGGREQGFLVGCGSARDRGFGLIIARILRRFGYCGLFGLIALRGGGRPLAGSHG
jgi:hypothetical protein